MAEVVDPQAPQSSYRQYIRKLGLTLGNTAKFDSATKLLDVSELRVVFRTQQMDVDAPSTAIMRVYNLSDTTARRIKNEFQSVALQAGYEGGNYGLIFRGTIIRIRTGRESAIDSFVDIMAADTDTAFNEDFCNSTLAAGRSLTDRFTAIAQDMKSGATPGNVDGLGTGGVLPRGKVLFGLASRQLTSLTETTLSTWSIQDGKINIIKKTGYLPAGPVLINKSSGMVGVPEATIGGIDVMTLLNPQIRLGTRVQLDNASINQTTNVNTSQGFPRYGDFQFFASQRADGIYRVLVAEHEGDSRGQPWYTRMTCLDVDASVTLDSGKAVAGN